MTEPTPIPWQALTPEFDADWWAGGDGLDPATQQVPDLLSTMFHMQAGTQQAMREKEIFNGSPEAREHLYGDVEDRVIQSRLHELYGYTIRELSEAMGLLKNKPWRDKHTPVDRDDFTEEVADAFLFLLEFCITAGITAEDLFAAYTSKTTTVHHRAQNGY